MARLYADEDIPFPVVECPRKLGHDVLTASEAGQANQGITDADQLLFATSLGRGILTRNRRHFVPLHSRFNHTGIVSITDDPDFDGQAQRIDDALAVTSTLANQHIRINRPNNPTKS